MYTQALYLTHNKAKVSNQSKRLRPPAPLHSVVAQIRPLLPLLGREAHFDAHKKTKRFSFHSYIGAKCQYNSMMTTMASTTQQQSLPANAATLDGRIMAASFNLPSIGHLLRHAAHRISLQYCCRNCADRCPSRVTLLGPRMPSTSVQYRSIGEPVVVALEKRPSSPPPIDIPQFK